MKPQRSPRFGPLADLAVALLFLVGSLCIFLSPARRVGAACFVAGSAAMAVAAAARLRDRGSA